MKKYFLFVFCMACFLSKSFSQRIKPDTVLTGIYITSIHDIDFKQQEYTVDFWLWLKYKDRKLDFENNLEIPLAKTVQKSFATADTVSGKIYLLLKLQCVMKDSWKINDFPFDKQLLRLSIENSQFDVNSMIFVPDTLGKHFDPKFTLQGWLIDSFYMSVGKKAYETTFGDPTLTKPHTEYSSFRVRLQIHRNAAGLFFKLFMGMYVAFLIAYVCFYIHADSIDSRFSLSVGALFAVIGNKYIVDASLPESLTFTLVDLLHAITLFFILGTVVVNAYSLKLIKKGRLRDANRFDLISAQILLIAYVVLNFYFIAAANAN